VSEKRESREELTEVMEWLYFDRTDWEGGKEGGREGGKIKSKKKKYISLYTNTQILIHTCIFRHTNTHIL
jgi:hypothetical protein